MIYYGNELYHHGILGQKWGIRRFQNKDGSYTPQGQSENNGHGRYSDTDGPVSKIRDSSSNKVTNSKSGLTDQQKKVLMGAAIGAAVALGVGTAVYITAKKKVNPTTGDITLDAGSVIQRISPSEEKDLHDVFYAAINEHDKKRYENMLQKHYKERGAESIFKKEIDVKQQIKVAGHESCKKIFNEMLDDPDLNSKMKKLGFWNEDKYDLFNQYAVAAREDGFKEVYDIFFNKVKEAGYQGFLDINDQSYSGYNAKAPVILFNDSNVFNQAKVTTLQDSAGEVINKYYKESSKAAIEQMIKDVVNNPITSAEIGAYATIGGAYIGMAAASSSTVNKTKKDSNSKSKKK